jgi:hypothetical protein
VFLPLATPVAHIGRVLIKRSETALPGPSLLAWLNDQQRTHFLREGPVEQIADRAEVPKVPTAQAVAECIPALAQLDVPLKAGRPDACSALRATGHKYSSETVAAAIKQRKERLARQTGEEAEDFEEIVV